MSCARATSRMGAILNRKRATSLMRAAAILMARSEAAGSLLRGTLRLIIGSGATLVPVEVIVEGDVVVEVPACCLESITTEALVVPTSKHGQ